MEQLRVAGVQRAPGAEAENGTSLVPFTWVEPEPEWPWHSAHEAKECLPWRPVEGGAPWHDEQVACAVDVQDGVHPLPPVNAPWQ